MRPAGAYALVQPPESSIGSTIWTAGIPIVLKLLHRPLRVLHETRRVTALDSAGDPPRAKRTRATPRRAKLPLLY